MRRFLATFLFVFLAFAISTAHAADSPRQTICFNSDWRFIKSDPAGAEQPSFDDSQWQTVCTPHSFNETDTFTNWSTAMGGEVNQFGGRTWYRKHFKAPADWAGKKIIIEFEAVRQVAEVYLNGKRIGSNSSGFVPFAFDLTPYLKIGQPNVLAVMCDNSFATSVPRESTEPNEGNAKLPWNNPRWQPPHGGIYRNVWLHILNPVHITLPIFSNLKTTGVYAYGSDVTATSATIGIEAQVADSGDQVAPVQLHAVVVDRDGKVVLQRDGSENLAPGETKVIKLSATLQNPQRWEPAYPYLYSVRLTLEAKGKLVDQTQVPLGLRSVKFDVTTGFTINDHHLKLHGWGQKPTDEWAGLASALPDWMHFYTIHLMQEAGGNFIRWGHCAAGPAQIAADDEYGQITDQPGVDGELDIKDPVQWEIRANAFRDTVIYYRNNPSILIWEGGNQKVTDAHAKQIRGYKDQYDPSGGRSLGFRRADAITGKYMEVSIGTEGSHEQRQLPVVEGEYDREESPRGVWDRLTPPNENFHDKGSYDLTAEQFALNEVGQWWEKIGSKPGHCGGANWIFSDTTTGGRVYTEVARNSGEVDAVRLPKEAYYACAGMFLDTPTAFLIGHWNYAPGTVKTVYVVSNQPKVELFLNDKSLGLGKQSDQYLYEFDNVKWEPGEIKAVAYGADGAQTAEQKKTTVDAPIALRITPITGPSGFIGDGSDVALFDVEAIDADGHRCPTVEQRVDFKMDGPAIWRGGYNTRKPGSTNNTYLDLEAGVNRVAIRSTMTPGTITLQAVSAGLKPASVSIKSKSSDVANGMSLSRPAVPDQGPLTPYDPSKEQKITIPAATVDQQIQGHFIEDFSYSGPTPGAAIAVDADDGKKIYADAPDVFRGLPAILKSADYLQLPTADANYVALDLISLMVKAKTHVFIARDNRFPLPSWLKAQYKPTGDTMQIGGKPFSIYEYKGNGGTLTLGGNTEETAQGDLAAESPMYIVFVNGK